MIRMWISQENSLQKILMKGFKMSYSNGMLSKSTAPQGGKDGKDGLPGVGFKLTSAGDFDLQRKRLTNVAEGTGNSDAITKHQVDTLATQLRADSLQVDGSSHMTGDLDLRGQKLIKPGEIQMNRKLITNLDTDENNDLSAVNMITLKKFHPNAPAHTHEVTKNIDLKELFNVVKSKQQTYNDFATNYDNLVSYNDVKNIFLSRKQTFPMETALDMGNHTIFHVKDPTVDDQGVNKRYVDKFLPLSGGTMKKKLSMGGNKIINIGRPMRDADAATKKFVVDKTGKCLLLAGGTMTGPINMGGKKMTNAATPTNPTDAATKFFVEKETQKCLSLGGGTMTGQIDMGGKKITNLGDPTDDKDVVNMKFVDAKISENGISAITHPPNEFDYLMKDVLESSSESNVSGVAIDYFAATPHKFNKKSYVMLISKRSADNMFLGRIGFNMYKIPEGEYTICVEFFPPKMDGVSVDAQSTALNVNRQATKVFKTYSRSIIHMRKWHISPPEYLMLDLKWQGAAGDFSSGTAHLIIYGVKEFQPDVPSMVFDYPFSFNSREMLMHTGLNLNGHKLTATIKSLVFAKFELRKNRNYLIFSNEDGQTSNSSQFWGFDFNVKDVVFDRGTAFSLELVLLTNPPKRKTVHSSQNPARFTFDTHVLKTERFYFWVNGLSEKYARATISIELV